MPEAKFDRNYFMEFRGPKDGPTSTILYSVHGGELPGIKAAARIINGLQRDGIEAGRVLIGCGHPEAMDQSVRALKFDVNRAFKPDEMMTADQIDSPEYRRAQVLKPYLKESDALLDLHGTRNPKAVPFVICEPNGFDIAQYLPVGITVSNIDALQPGGTDWYMNQVLKKPGICLEPGYFYDPTAADRAEHGSWAFLKAMGNISGEKIPVTQRRIEVYQLYATESSDFTLAKRFKDFEDINKGQLVAVDGERGVIADRPSVIVFPSQPRIITPRVDAYFLAQDIRS